MAALRQTLVVEQGATFKFVVSIVGGPSSLIGYTGRMQVRPFPGHEDVYVDLTTENGGLSIDTANRLVTIEIPWQETQELDWDTAQYDLEIEGDGKVYRVMQGPIRLNREITV